MLGTQPFGGVVPPAARGMMCAMHGTPVLPSPVRGTPETGVNPIFVSVAEAARILDLSTKTIYRLVESGGLDGRRQGRRVSVSYTSIEAYAKRLPRASR